LNVGNSSGNWQPYPETQILAGVKEVRFALIDIETPNSPLSALIRLESSDGGLITLDAKNGWFGYEPVNNSASLKTRTGSRYKVATDALYGSGFNDDNIWKSATHSTMPLEGNPVVVQLNIRNESLSS
jgi:hypothetical protein